MEFFPYCFAVCVWLWSLSNENEAKIKRIQQIQQLKLQYRDENAIPYLLRMSNRWKAKRREDVGKAAGSSREYVRWLINWLDLIAVNTLSRHDWASIVSHNLVQTTKSKSKTPTPANSLPKYGSNCQFIHNDSRSLYMQIPKFMSDFHLTLVSFVLYFLLVLYFWFMKFEEKKNDKLNQIARTISMLALSTVRLYYTMISMLFFWKWMMQRLVYFNLQLKLDH